VDPVARVVEEAGISTVLVSTGRNITRHVLPPRSVFLNFPMGNPFGRADDAQMQDRVLRDALRLVETASEGGGLVDLPCDWGEDFGSIADP
jgi:hypothetical protein